MKKIFVLLAVLLIANFSQAAEIEGFWGIKFGTYPDSAKAAMLAKPGVTFTGMDNEGFVFEAKDFAGYPVTIILYPGENGFKSAFVSLHCAPEDCNYYAKELLGKLKIKYGEPAESDEYNKEYNWRGRSGEFSTSVTLSLQKNNISIMYIGIHADEIEESSEPDDDL